MSLSQHRPARTRAIPVARESHALALVSLLSVIGLALCAGAGWLRVT